MRSIKDLGSRPSFRDKISHPPIRAEAIYPDMRTRGLDVEYIIAPVKSKLKKE